MICVQRRSSKPIISARDESRQPCETVDMATAKPSNSTELEDIQRRMAQIRHDMHGEVRQAVKGAQSLTDWRSLVRNHPWLTVGVAAPSAT